MSDDVLYDFAIIGAGICGACTAYELSKRDARICLIEKENDTGCGASKANSELSMRAMILSPEVSWQN